MSAQAAASNLNAQAVSGGVLARLLAFSIALGVLPIVSYFGSLNYLWEGNATYAAITAIIAANIVLVTYIIVSVLEDRQNAAPQPKSQKEKPETKKR
ncbi:hypothetical protein NLJ89_g11714 [Agrocybe chaxingu]|uniref:Vacuolar ATPase assembly integral membrane protein VMA21 n=1 Tax=Agrocybe chaxingu TaxID=84603 RepID=A0A9W8MMS7_9AGAR|nr:hypothetical protein NLJ89_g11714 [Agrocybe chaxingu]